MAYTYDDFGNVVFVETEEERRRREEEERQRTVQTQTVETAADGSQTVTTKSQVPAQADVYEYAPVGFQTGVPALQPPQLPVLPVVAQVPSARAITPQGLQPRPINPQEVFRNMVQAESGGQNFDQFGRPLTSPKGAMFANQVMPATAAQPGYGVRPAQAQTAEEFNRVGRDYFSAMLTEFNGDQQKAAAAYNAGPGRIRQAEQMAQQRGGSWRDYIPRETIAYLGRVFERMIPSAQAATLPQPAAGRQPMPQVAGQYDYAPVGFQTGAPVAPTVAAVDQYDYAPVGFQTGVAPSAVETAAPAAAPAAAPEAAPETTVTSTQVAIDRYQTAQDNPMALLALKGDQRMPEFIRIRAGDRAAELMQQEVGKRTAAENAKALIAGAAAGDRQAANTIARELQNKEGSWLKMILLGFISPDLAGEEAVKLGFGNRWVATRDAQGNPALIETNAKGLPLKGFTADGTAISANDLVKYAAGIGVKGAEQGAQVFADPTGTVKGTFILERRPGQTPVYKRVGGGADATPEESNKLIPIGVGGTLETQGLAQIQKQNIELAGDWEKAKIAIAKAGPQAQAEEAGRFNFKHGTNYRPEQFTGTAPQISFDTRRLIGGPEAMQAAPAQAAPAQAIAPPAQAAPAQAIAPPTQAAPVAAVTPPAVTAGPNPYANMTVAQMQAAGASPGAIESELDRRKNESKLEREVRETREKEAAKANQTFTDSLNQARRSGIAQRATIDRLQSAIAANPDFWGIDTNSAAWRAFVDINSTNENRQAALDTFARNLNIPKERRAAFDQVMNDYRNLQVNAITSSGLTASQTNTERESQRVIGTVGSIADRPAAARATLEYARAKIDYTEAKSRAWAQARRANPAADYSMFELDFDATQGEQIFKDANDRMYRIINRPSIAATQTAPGAAPQAGPAQAPSITPADRARQELERRRRERGGQ